MTSVAHRATPVVHLRGALKRFGNVIAVHDLDIDIVPGEVVAVLGPNGAGKTTAVHLILGLRRPTAGTVEVYGQRPTSHEARVRSGAVLQNASLPSNLKVRELVTLFRHYYPDPLPLPDVLDLAGIGDLSGRFFAELSGGQQQRVFLALALCGQPQMLVLDEPSAGMDIEARAALWQTVRKVAATGVAVVLTTHYHEEADALADRVVLIADGTTVVDGSPADLKALFVSRSVTLRPTRAPDLTALTRIGATDVTYVDGMLRLTTHDPGRVLRKLLEDDPTARDIEVRGVSLEDAIGAILRDRPPPAPVLPAPDTAPPRRTLLSLAKDEWVSPRTWFRLVRAQARVEFLKLSRDSSFVVITCLLPTVFYAFVGTAVTDVAEPELYSLASMSAYGAIGVGLFGFGVGIAAERGLRWDLLVRASPMRPTAYLAARVAPSAFFTVLTLAILGAYAALVVGVDIGLAGWLRLVGGLTSGSVAFIVMGLALGYNLPPRIAMPVATVFYLPLSFASGLFVPIDALPGAVQTAAAYLPTWHYARIGWAALGVGPGFGLTSVLVLGGYTVLFGALAMYGYRREIKSRYL